MLIIDNVFIISEIYFSFPINEFMNVFTPIKADYFAVTFPKYYSSSYVMSPDPLVLLPKG